MSDNPMVVKMTGGAEKVVLPKGSYKAVITNVKFSPISEWPEWKVTSTIQRHNEREDERAAEAEKDGRAYEIRYAESERDLSLAERGQYVWFLKTVGGKHPDAKLRPLYTGVSLNAQKKYRTKANLYKLLDAALPDVEEWIAANPDGVNVADAIGYPLMVSLDKSEKGNQTYKAFVQSDDHGKRDENLVMEASLGVTEVKYEEVGEDAPPIPF